MMKRTQRNNLKQELGRYRKKVADQQKEISRLRLQVIQHEQGARELSTAVDAVFAGLAKQFGKPVENSGDMQLVIPGISLSGLKPYEVHAHKVVNDPPHEDEYSYHIRLTYKEET